MMGYDKEICVIYLVAIDSNSHSVPLESRGGDDLKVKLKWN